ncbi:MAG TPA: hypothetical protein VG269_26635 [Tepidisphaeraceae bacterium]|jgi:hypothetical protein|nr:hypothetical protein [Tepidisphaeraceae bacterium]
MRINLPAAGTDPKSRTLFDRAPHWFDARKANGKATSERPLQAIYVEGFRAKLIEFVVVDSRYRLITNATWGNNHLHLTLYVEGAAVGTTEQMDISTAELFAGRFRFGAPG